MIGGGHRTILPFHPTCQFHPGRSRNHLSTLTAAGRRAGSSLPYIIYLLESCRSPPLFSLSVSLNPFLLSECHFYATTYLHLLTRKTSHPSKNILGRNALFICSCVCVGGWLRGLEDLWEDLFITHCQSCLSTNK